MDKQTIKKKYQVQKQKELRNAKIIRAVIAVGLAIILWVYINGTSTDIISQDFKNIPITINNAEKLAVRNLALADERDYSVNLRLQGTDKNLQAIDVSKLKAEIDLSEINASGDQSLPVVIQGLPNSVILSKVEPENITLHIIELEQKQFAVQVNANGKPESGYRFESGTARETVTVSGDQEKIDQIDKLIATVDVSGLNTDSQQYAAVRAYDKEGDLIEGLNFDPYKVFVEITIKKE